MPSPPIHIPLRTLARRLACLVLCLFASLAAHAAGGATLVLDEPHGSHDLWPAVRVLDNAAAPAGWAAALQRLPDFTVPAGPAGNLGVVRHPVWVAARVRTADGSGRWVFALDYPPLKNLDLFVLAEGRLLQHVPLGAALPYESRPLHGRDHAVELTLAPGVEHLLLMRVESDGSMVLPMSLSTPDAYHAREGRRLVVTGLLFGIAAALLAYSLGHGLALRSRLFALYGVLLLGNALFFADLSGLGQMLLWSTRAGLAGMVSPLSVFLSIAAGAPFVILALQTQVHSPRLHWGLVGLGSVATVMLLAGLAGLLNYRQAQVVATLIGPFVPVLAIPAAWRRARQGERIGLYMLLGWSSYVAGAVGMVCLLRGLLPANVWTMHLYQAAALLEMLAWLRVLGLNIEAVQREAEHNAAAVRDLSAIALVDALTGLPNRRGLDAALHAALQRASPERLLAVFLIDLDGFKAVNDRLGHAAGDRLLQETAQRLVKSLRGSDTVARLGGDEFVVLAEGLPGELDARAIGAKLLDSFAEPVPVDGVPCRIGLTIGYALAPVDGTEAAELLRSADTAMYAGKRAGRHQVRRASAALPQAA